MYTCKVKLSEDERLPSVAYRNIFLLLLAERGSSCGRSPHELPPFFLPSILDLRLGKQHRQPIDDAEYDQGSQQSRQRREQGRRTVAAK